MRDRACAILVNGLLGDVGRTERVIEIWDAARLGDTRIGDAGNVVEARREGCFGDACDGVFCEVRNAAGFFVGGEGAGGCFDMWGRGRLSTFPRGGEDGPGELGALAERLEGTTIGIALPLYTPIKRSYPCQ
eukprot:Hpha_TRINITY_DN5924_c0_g1::TRINITY_DN5924_c0_g1_i1::g.147249::m.147249